jgi:hypothetical protein
MAKNQPAPATEKIDISLAEAVSAKAGEELQTLLLRNWPDILEYLEETKEIKIAACIAITNRPPSTGEQAAKDSRLKVTISFSKKHSDSMECPLPNPDQMDLKMT